MAWIWIIIVIIGVLLFGWSSAVEPTASGVEDPRAATVVVRDPVQVWPLVRIGTIEGVILPEADADRLTAGLVPGDEVTYWTPTTANVERAEQVIAAEQGDLQQMRQYAGFIEDDQRKIVVNGFCDDLGFDWQTSDIVRVDDGGDCYFTAIFNVDADELESFQFNGEG